MRTIECGEAVDALLSALQLPDEYRPPIRQIVCDRAVDIEPEQRLAIDREMARERRVDESRQPGARRDDQSLGAIRLCIRRDLHLLRGLFEARHALAAVDLCAALLGDA